MQFKFKEWDVKPVFGKYLNGQNSIQLVDPNDGCPVATASVALEGLDIREDQVAIKDYSENEGMAKTLVDAGIIGDCVARVPSGFVTIPIHELLIKS